MTEHVEEWRPVVGYEGIYEVSSHGRVRSLARKVLRSDGVLHPFAPKVLSPRRQRQGYLYVALYRDKIRRDAMIHTLVAAAFIGPRPQGMDICHGNDIKTDNRPENLRYDTRSANVLDSVRNGTHQGGRRTHCIHGHEYTAENTAIYGGRRACRACHRINSRKRRAKANA